MAPPHGQTLTRAAMGATVVVAASAVAALATDDGAAGWEVAAGRWAFDLPGALTPLLEVVMQAGTRPAIAVVALALALSGWRWRAAGVGAAGVVAWALAQLGKDVVDRPRPTEALLDRVPREVLANPGFPSSHTAIATALATAFLLLGRRRRAPATSVAAAAVAVAALTALARLHLGVHWSLDVVGGGGLGVLAGIAVAAVVDAFGEQPAEPIERTGDPADLLVATFNIRNGRAWDGWNSWPFRAGATVAMARQLDADILAVQEAYGFQARTLSWALPGYDRVGRGRGRRGGEWCAVYVRSDRLRVLSWATRWFGDHTDVPGSRLPEASFPRVATHARLHDLVTGADLDVVNTHLDERRPDNRLRSMQQLVSWLDPGVPAIVLGDLNATPRREPELFADLAAAGLVDAVPADAGGTAHDYRGGTDHHRIDHIFVSRAWTVLEAKVVADDRRRGYPSDHWPVSARLRLG